MARAVAISLRVPSGSAARDLMLPSIGSSPVTSLRASALRRCASSICGWAGAAASGAGRGVRPPVSPAAAMLAPFFVLAARSPARQHAFRELLAAHLLVLLGGSWLAFHGGTQNPAANLGHLLLVAGIVEGAVLIG